ncbi:MAG: hypothetical protein ACXVLQ_07705 [Bacteriovorax sp.]
MGTDLFKRGIKLKSFFIFLVSLISIQVFADTSTELKMIVSDSTRQAVALKVSGKLSPSGSFSPEEMQILLNDLNALYELKGTQVSSPLYKEIFLTNQFDGKMLFAWIFKKIQFLAPSKGAKCGESSTYVGCYLPAENKMILPPSFFNLGRIGRLAILIHEARHADGFSHIPGSLHSEDDIINGARGAEWSFLRGLSSSCVNCRLMDRLSAYGSAQDVIKNIINLPSNDNATYLQEINSLKNPLDEKYTALEKSLKIEKSAIHVMPTLCMGEVPFNEFKGNVEITPTEDCVLVYYFVNSEDARKNPALLKRSLETRDGFLIVLNPVEKK